MLECHYLFGLKILIKGRLQFLSTFIGIDILSILIFRQHLLIDNAPNFLLQHFGIGFIVLNIM